MRGTPYILASIIALLAAGCATGAMWEDMAPSEIGLPLEDGETDVPPDKIFSITFVKPVDIDTVNSSTFFLMRVEEPSSPVSKGTDDSAGCDPADAVAGHVECTSPTQCAFVPDAPLDSGVKYALCLTNSIEYADGNRYPGSAITFTTTAAARPQDVVESPADEEPPAEATGTSPETADPTADAPADVPPATDAAAQGEITGGVLPAADIIGELDPTFDGDGIVVYDNATGETGGYYCGTLAIDSSGRILLECSQYVGGVFDPVLFRYNSDGSIDTSFGAAGVVYFSGSAAGGYGFDYSNDMIIDSSGRILVTGSSSNASGTSDMPIWRYTSDGVLDASFDGDGIVTHDSAAGGGSYDSGSSITTDPSGRIIVAGCSKNVRGNYDMALWRYHSDGTPDAAFGIGGVAIHDNAAGGGGLDCANAVTVDPSGKIFVGGNSYNGSNLDAALWQFASDGTLDPSFGDGGIAVHGGAGGGNGDDQMTQIKVDPMGRILATGGSTNADGNPDMVIWRYKRNGTLDTSFGSGGVVVHNSAAGGNDRDFGNDITADSSNRILITGLSRDAGGNFDMVIWGYEKDGEIDSTFGNNGVIVYDGAAGGNGMDFVGSSIAIDSSGRILIGGIGQNPAGKIAATIWRYR